MDNQNANNKNIINNSNHYNNNIYMNTGAETTGASDGKTHYLSNNHLSPDYNGTGGQTHLRRRSSAYLDRQQLDSCRRLSAVSGHSIAMAMDIKRKSHMEGEGHREGDSIDVPEHEQMSFTMKCVYTSIMMLIHHNFGLSVSGFAPSYVDWTVMLRTNMTYIGLIPIFQAIGGICGSICGTLYKWLPRQLVLLFVVILMAMATIFMPYSTEIWHLYICIFFYGCGVGAWNNSNNVWLIEMWQKRSPTMLLLSQGIYGVGTILGPMVVKPYLSGISQSDKPTGDNMNDTMAALLASQVSDKLKTPFLITGCIEVIGPIIMFILFFIKPYKFTSLTKREDEMAVTEADKARLEEERRVIPKKTLIVCTAIFFATGFMTENMYVDFAPSYFQFVPNLRLSAQTAADIASTMAIALAGGRFLCILLAMKLRPHILAKIFSGCYGLAQP
ncbi:unnamed protein product [Medioppia subpectinata]|uniref:Uncharacterized protein n=1 Tax=Medioppia subpectinata TaxID=1979941 RepID=A0A7R9KL06_9ACAR|nr:unnamed protein product [Medioppia subpectinata]CAG2105536.1 unnamed protein product [Medioppia subpectinata]